MFDRSEGDRYSVARLVKYREAGGPEVVACRFCGRDVDNTQKRRLRHMDVCTALVGHSFRIEAMKVSKLHAEFKRREAVARREQKEADEKRMQALQRDLREYIRTRQASQRLVAWVRKGKWIE